ncbi:MAG TPA: hypothetical protein PLG75_06950 [Methanoculleus sp.]|nr:hypothetical protein [Methanoculleus sp.]
MRAGEETRKAAGVASSIRILPGTIWRTTAWSPVSITITRIVRMMMKYPRKVVPSAARPAATGRADHPNR